MREPREEYLGDGLFASFDGWQIKLRAPRDNCDHEVYLEPGILEALINFAKRCKHADVRGDQNDT
jgi:hypothetical protein